MKIIRVGKLIDGLGHAPVAGATVVVEGATMTAIGLVAGLAGAYAATGALRSLLFQVQPLDLTTFVVASAVLAGVALTAVYMPARRATRVNPLTVLREE